MLVGGANRVSGKTTHVWDTKGPDGEIMFV
jgi:hypothetical protein